MANTQIEIMDLEGKYEWVNSKRTGKPIISFVLHSTRWLRDEHFDVMLQDAAGMRAPKVFANLTLEHGKSYRFDFDTAANRIWYEKPPPVPY